MWGFCKQWVWDQLQGFLKGEGYVLSAESKLYEIIIVCVCVCVCVCVLRRLFCGLREGDRFHCFAPALNMSP